MAIVTRIVQGAPDVGVANGRVGICTGDVELRKEEVQGGKGGGEVERRKGGGEVERRKGGGKVEEIEVERMGDEK